MKAKMFGCKLKIILSLMLTAFVLCSCGSKGGSSEIPSEVPESATEAEAPAAESGYNNGFAPAEGGEDGGFESARGENDATASLKIIKSSYITINAQSIQSALGSIKDYASNCGGYVESSDMNTHDDRSTGIITIRVPREQYDAAIARVTSLGKVLSQSDQTENVTMQYIDNEGQLKVKRIEEERLLELIAKADNIDSIIVLEKRLSEIRQDVEYLTSTLRKWDDLTSMSTITVQIEETKTDTLKTNNDTDFSTNLHNAFTGGLNLVLSVFRGIMLFLAYCWFWLLLAAVVSFILLKSDRGFFGKKKHKESKKTQEKEDELK